jgi:hypothetical protein
MLHTVIFASDQRARAVQDAAVRVAP